MTALWSTITNEKSLLSLCHAHLLSTAIFAGLEVGLFDTLSRLKTATIPVVAEAVGMPISSVKRLIVLLRSLGLLEERDGHIRNSQLADKSLVSTSPNNLTSVLIHQGRHVYPAYAKLTEALQTAAAPSQSSNRALRDRVDDRELEIFLEGANFYSRGLGLALTEALDLASAQRVVVLGAGGGQEVQEILEAVPHLFVTLVDRPETVAYLTSRPEMLRYGVRLSYIEGNLLEPLSIESETADVVVLSSVLGDWDKETRSTILSQARSILKADGTLLITETLLDDDGLGPLRAGVISLYVLLLTKGGNNYPASFWNEELSENGFAMKDIIRNAEKGMRDIIVARKHGM